MDLIGFFPLLLIVVAVSTWRSHLRGHAVTPKLALSEFAVQPQAGGAVVRIAGTSTGPAAVIQTLLGLESDSSFEATACGCQIHAVALWGQKQCFAPLEEITSVQAGQFRSVGFLFVGAFLFCVGLAGVIPVLIGNGGALGGIPAMIIGLLFFLAYYLSKALFVSVQTRGGTEIRIVFEQGPADLAATLNAANAIRGLLQTRHRH